MNSQIKTGDAYIDFYGSGSQIKGKYLRLIKSSEPGDAYVREYECDQMDPITNCKKEEMRSTAKWTNMDVYIIITYHCYLLHSIPVKAAHGFGVFFMIK